MNRETTGFGVALVMVLLVGSAPAWEVLAGEPSDVDPEAARIAAEVLDAMGGEAAWSATRFLRFGFFGFRLHHWDRHTGRHRLEGETREGVSYVVIHRIGDEDGRSGRVWLDGREATGDERGQWLDRAYSAWVNDTYWLIMPYKLRDPGVRLRVVGEETLDGRLHDKLELTFEAVGLTPGDTYWAYIDRETRLMTHWAYLLQDWEDEREPALWRWEDWQAHGDIMLSPVRRPLPEGEVRTLDRIAVFDQLPDSVFGSPEPVVLE